MINTEKNSLRETVDRGPSLIPFYTYHHNEIDHNLYLHWHNEFEIIYVERGTIVYTIDTVPVKVSEGQCIIINSGQFHSAHSINNNPCLHFALLFDLNFLNSTTNDYCQSNYITPLLDGAFRFPLLIEDTSTWGKLIINEVKEAVEIYDQKAFGWEIGIKASLYKIVSTVARENMFIIKENAPNSSLNNKIDIIKKSINYLHNNYTKKIYIHDLANEVNMNPQYFCRFFKANTGKTPIDFINQYRIEKATQLMKITDKKISNIYLEVGFDNFSYFIKKFKEYKNCTPNQFRNL